MPVMRDPSSYPKPKVAIGSRWRMKGDEKGYLITITEVTEYAVRFQYDFPRPPWSRNIEGYDSYDFQGWHVANERGILKRAENGLQRAKRILCLG